ncbi:MAG TPA: O-antigen ligase family protein [Nocardioidaceae bacterium]|nr:O-antigen ligase family protein [Nocardioidaceae bacterium]
MRTFAYRLMIIMVFTLPWENVVDLPGVGRVSKVVGLLVALVWVIAVVKSGRVREPRAVHVLALFFVLWNACSLMWTVDGPATQERVFTYVQLLGLMLVVWDTVTTLAAVRQALVAYVAGCYVTSAALLISYAAEGAGAEVHGRVTVGSFHPNDVGMVLALGVPIVGYLIAAPGVGRWRRLGLVASAAYIPIAGFAILVTGSRAALGAMVPGGLYLGYQLARRRPAVAVGSLVALVVLTVLALPLVPAKVLSRLEGTEAAVEAGDLNERREVWGEALRIIHADPVIGIGGGAFRAAAVGVNKVGHNFVLALLAEVGVIGFGLFLAMLVVALLSVRRMTPLLRGMWLAMFSAWLFAALLHNWEYRKQTWLIIALVVACGALGREDEGEDLDQEVRHATRPAR